MPVEIRTLNDLYQDVIEVRRFGVEGELEIVSRLFAYRRKNGRVSGEPMSHLSVNFVGSLPNAVRLAT